jgi:hypothetical protein
MTLGNDSIQFLRSLARIIVRLPRFRAASCPDLIAAYSAVLPVRLRLQASFIVRIIDSIVSPLVPLVPISICTYAATPTNPVCEQRHKLVNTYEAVQPTANTIVHTRRRCLYTIAKENYLVGILGLWASFTPAASDALAWSRVGKAKFPKTRNSNPTWYEGKYPNALYACLSEPRCLHFLVHNMQPMLPSTFAAFPAHRCADKLAPPCRQ